MRRPVLAAALAIALIPATSAAEETAPPSETPDNDAPTATENRVAYAGPPGTYVAEPEAEPPAPAPVPPPAATGLQALRDSDAAAGRAFLFPTAITGKKGSVRIEAWWPTMPVAGLTMLSYSVHDKVEIGAGAFWIADELDGDQAIAPAFRIKVAPLRTARGGIALEYQHMVIPDESDAIKVLTVVGSHCLDGACRVLGSLHASAIPEKEAYDDNTGSYGPALHTFGGASLVAGGKTKLVLDLVTAEEDDDRIFAGYAGVRFARGKWAFDAGLVAGGADGDAEALPLPLVGGTARW